MFNGLSKLNYVHPFPGQQPLVLINTAFNNQNHINNNNNLYLITSNNTHPNLVYIVPQQQQPQPIPFNINHHIINTPKIDAVLTNSINNIPCKDRDSARINVNHKNQPILCSVKHNGDKSGHACMHCCKIFTTKHNLKQHLVTHFKIKPFECNICNKRFSQKHRYDDSLYSLH